MSGSTSRSGFAFQDLILAERVLSHILARRAAEIAGAPVPSLRFGIEASPVPGKAPEWDSLQKDANGRLLLEEAKSGTVDADDRWTLWRRVRRTVDFLAREGDASEVAVRLTVNAASLPDHPEHWRMLPTRSQSASGDWSTPATKDDGKLERKRGVRSAEDLANEALHVLTSADADETSPALSMERARAVLACFSLNEAHSADSVETAVLQHLSAMSWGVGVQELLSGLQGELSRRAVRGASERTFGADEVLRSLSTLERLATIDPRALRIWHALNGIARARELDQPPLPKGLTYQDWRPLQPTVAAAVDRPGPFAVALLGRGGLGKTVVLERWIVERRAAGDVALFLEAKELASVSSDQLSEAFDLGAFAARHSGHRLVVAVDGIENIADQPSRINVLSALRRVAVESASICVSSRLLEWRSTRGSSESVGGWETAEVCEWPEDRVKHEVNASSRPSVGLDLLRLLRTPLLLDLFLRTFGHDAEVPQGLQSRHGLLQAYWDRRILPPDDERSAERREMLLRIAEDEAAGIASHTLVGDAPRDLTSEGLLVSSGGQRTFRHALLRDFAMMGWAQERTVSPEEVVGKLEGIRPSLVQFGALRAVLEATAGTTSILPALTPPLLFHAATVLGEFEDVLQFAVPVLLDAVRAADRSGFLTALLSAVKLNHNLRWATVFAQLPNDERWAETTGWLDADAFLQFTNTLQAMSDDLSADVALAAAVAARLRTWSLAPRILSESTATGGFGLGRVIELLRKIDPSPETVHWLARIVAVGPWTRFWVLSELPALVRTLVGRNCPLDDDELQQTYRTAAGLREDGGRLRDDLNIRQDAATEYSRIDLALIGEGTADGLISSRPSAFIPVAIDMIAGHEADSADQREARRRDILARIPSDLQWIPDPKEPAIEQLETMAQGVAGADLRTEDADDALIVDTPTDPYWDIGSEHAQLLLHVRSLAERSLGEDHALFTEIYWPAVARSRSAIARICTLDLLTRGESCPENQILDDLLRDGRLYLLECAGPYLQRGIRRRWASLPPQYRAEILKNILESGRAPSGNIYTPGPFLAALPVADYPAELGVFVELYQVRGWSLELEEGLPSTLISADDAPKPDRTWEPIVGLAPEQQDPWKRFGEWERGRILQATASEWSALVDAVEALVARSLPSPHSLLNRADLVDRLCEFVNLHASSPPSDQRTRRVMPDVLRNMAGWSVDALGSFCPRDVVADCEPFDGTNVGLPPRAELWMGLAELADSLLWEAGFGEDVDLNDALFKAVGAVAEDLPARLAWNILTRVRGWFRANGRGKGVLRTLLVERVRNSRALTQGLRYLEDFARAEQQQLIRNWMMTDLSPPVSPPRVFAREAGQHLGWSAMMRYESGNPTGSRDLIRELVKSPSSAGILSDPSVHALFVAQSVFGAKQALAGGGVPLVRAAEYVAYMHDCWKALLPSLSEGDRKDAPAFALWVFHAILDAEGNHRAKNTLSAEERIAWWRVLRPLASAIVREGPSREINSLLRCMKGSPLVALVGGGEVLDVLREMQARTARLTRATTGYHWDDAISCASAVIESVAVNTTEPVVRDHLHALVAEWAAPPLANEAAGLAAKRLRE